MSAHTAGLLRFEDTPRINDGLGYIYRDDGSVNPTIANTGDTALPAEQNRADARRLVACWNACGDLSTEQIEDGVVVKLRDDRDALLVAIKNLRAAISDFKGHGMPGFTDRATAYVVMVEADGAIAKATQS